jgi:two-component system phosphate regulon response regulator PhoB
VCIVEDEPAQVELLSYNLASEGYNTVVAVSGASALDLVEDTNPDLIVLDWMLPDISGIEVCRLLRSRVESKSIPIIMLTARGEEADRVQGLEIGADDYIVKPYSPKEMMARVRALLRRSHPSLVEETLNFSGIVMDLVRHKVTRNGKSVYLGPTEYRLLLTFMERPSRVLSRAQLLDLAWGRDVFVEERTVDVHIRRLRKALMQPDCPDVIRTVRGAGYSLDISK